MVTLALVSSVFMIAGDLLQGAMKAMRFQSYKTATEQAAQMALQRLSADSLGAINLTTGSSTYVIQKIDPNPAGATHFYDSTISNPSGPKAWNSYRFLCNVTYNLSAVGTLTRQITSYDSGSVVAASTAQSVAYNLNAFTTSNVSVATSPAPSSPSNVNITITVQEESIVRPLSISVWIPTANP
jgi:hypothetical protein